MEAKYLYELDSWDGSDIYLPEGSSAVIITPEVKELLEKNKITGCEFSEVLVYLD